jgi:hypothetical protein
MPTGGFTADTPYTRAPGFTAIDPALATVGVVPAPEAESGAPAPLPSACAKTSATPVQADSLIPPSVTGADRYAPTASIRDGSVPASGKFCTFVATYVAIEVPPAVTYWTRWYVFPTGVYGLLVRTSTTESMILVVPSQ